MGAADSKAGAAASPSSGERKVKWKGSPPQQPQHGTQPPSSGGGGGGGVERARAAGKGGGRAGGGGGKNDRVYYENLNRARKNSIERISGMRLAGWLSREERNGSDGRAQQEALRGISRSAPPSPHPTASPSQQQQLAGSSSSPRSCEQNQRAKEKKATSAAPSPIKKNEKRKGAPSASLFGDNALGEDREGDADGRVYHTEEEEGRTKTKTKTKKKKKKTKTKAKANAAVPASEASLGSDGPEMRRDAGDEASDASPSPSSSSGSPNPAAPRSPAKQRSSDGGKSPRVKRKTTTAKKKKKTKTKTETRSVGGSGGDDGHRAEKTTETTAKAEEEELREAFEERKRKRKKKKKKMAKRKQREEEVRSLERWDSDVPLWLSKAIELEEEWGLPVKGQRSQAKHVEQDGDDDELELLFDNLLHEVTSKLQPPAPLVLPTASTTVMDRATASALTVPATPPTVTPRAAQPLARLPSTTTTPRRDEPKGASGQPSDPPLPEQSVGKGDDVVAVVMDDNDDDEAVRSDQEEEEEEEWEKGQDSALEERREEPTELQSAGCDDSPPALTSVLPALTGDATDEKKSEEEKEERRKEAEGTATMTATTTTTTNTTTADSNPAADQQQLRAKRAFSPRNRESVRNLVNLWELRVSPAASPVPSVASSPSRSTDRRQRLPAASRFLDTPPGSPGIAQRLSDESVNARSSTTNLGSPALAGRGGREPRKGASLGRREWRNLNKILTAIDEGDSSDVSMLSDQRSGSGHFFFKGGSGSVGGRSSSPHGWRAFARSESASNFSSGSDSGGPGKGKASEEGQSCASTSESDSDRERTVQQHSQQQPLPSGTTVLQLTKRLMHSPSVPRSNGGGNGE